MSATDEARAEAAQRYPMHDQASIWHEMHLAGFHAFLAGAEWQASRTNTPTLAERVPTEICLGNKRDEDGYPWICSLPPGHPMKDRMDHKWVRDV